MFDLNRNENWDKFLDGYFFTHFVRLSLLDKNLAIQDAHDILTDWELAMNRSLQSPFPWFRYTEPLFAHFFLRKASGGKYLEWAGLVSSPQCRFQSARLKRTLTNKAAPILAGLVSASEVEVFSDDDDDEVFLQAEELFSRRSSRRRPFLDFRLPRSNPCFIVCVE